MVFLVRESDEKVRSFTKLKGPVSYLFHMTSPECVYSICRNRIMNMSYTKYQKHNASYGPGIYMSNLVPWGLGSVALVYAAKRAKKVSYYYYIVQPSHICLRAIVWDPLRVRYGMNMKDVYWYIHRASWDV